VDIYGAARAGFGVSALVCGYGAMQAIISRPVGTIIERYGFMPVCMVFAVLPLIAYVVVHWTVRDDASNTA